MSEHNGQLPNGASGTSDIEGKAETGSGERGGSQGTFNSKKTYVSGKLHPDVRVPFREVSLASTKLMSGKIEVNEPVRVYDTSGPWGDPDFRGEVTRGLPPLRAKWILDRGDVETIAGRETTLADDGYLSKAHAEHAANRARMVFLHEDFIDAGCREVRAFVGLHERAPVVVEDDGGDEEHFRDCEALEVKRHLGRGGPEGNDRSSPWSSEPGGAHRRQ